MRQQAAALIPETPSLLVRRIDLRPHVPDTSCKSTSGKSVAVSKGGIIAMAELDRLPALCIAQ